MCAFVVPPLSECESGRTNFATFTTLRSSNLVVVWRSAPSRPREVAIDRPEAFSFETCAVSAPPFPFHRERSRRRTPVPSDRGWLNGVRRDAHPWSVTTARPMHQPPVKKYLCSLLNWLWPTSAKTPDQRRHWYHSAGCYWCDLVILAQFRSSPPRRRAGWADANLPSHNTRWQRLWPMSWLRRDFLHHLLRAVFDGIAAAHLQDLAKSWQHCT